ncbi:MULTISPECIES: DUF1254 domain-containing protein [unclassified Ensifer]|uniref:DUF1254 domain-containing protein n=1 Tax=Ensifer sp. Root31 TaxID=1736512 RepID=UPI0011B20EA7
MKYKEGAPSKETVDKVYDYVDLMHGVEAFVNAYQGASVAAIFKGFEDAGVPDNTAVIWSDLMDAKSLFLAANADTVYFWVNLNVADGPLVIETPPMSLGVIDDIWFRWVTEEKAVDSCWCLPATKGTCPKVDTSCTSWRPLARQRWAARSLRTTTPNLRWN